MADFGCGIFYSHHGQFLKDGSAMGIKWQVLFPPWSAFDNNMNNALV